MPKPDWMIDLESFLDDKIKSAKVTLTLGDVSDAKKSEARGEIRGYDNVKFALIGRRMYEGENARASKAGRK